MARSEALDAVRGIAIAAVAAVHVNGAIGRASDLSGVAVPATWATQVANQGVYGVYLFYALSGWLIFSIYYSGTSFGARSYWARRIARIWPLWLVFLAISLLAEPVAGAIGYAGHYSWIQVGEFPLLLQFLIGALFLGWLYLPLANTPPGGWSIQVEMGHYALFPLVRRRGLRVLVASVLIGYATYFAARFLSLTGMPSVIEWFAEGWVRLGLYGTWPFFVIGGVAALAWRDRDRLRERLSGYATSPSLAVLVVGAVLLFLVVPVPFGDGPTALGVVMVLAAVGVAIARIGRWGRMTQSLGRYSYFIYFAHFFVLDALAIPLAALLRNGWFGFPLSGYLLVVLMWLATLVISWSVGWVSWRIFESPIIRWAHRW